MGKSTTLAPDYEQSVLAWNYSLGETHIAGHRSPLMSQLGLGPLSKSVRGCRPSSLPADGDAPAKC